VNVVIVHYHLRRGGVTRVIETACQSLTPRGVRPLVLVGEYEAATGLNFGEATVRVIPGLRYADRMDRGVASQLAHEIEAEARHHFGTLPDVIHLHNPTLGKSPAVALLPGILAARGAALLIQVHDFAENGRPENYRRLVRECGGGDARELEARLYPSGGRIRYAALNRRDLSILQAAGADAEWLPNAVAAHPPARTCFDPPQIPWDAFAFFPSRAIRRKNLGEALLWLTAAPASCGMVVPMGPEQSADLEFYEEWKHFARQRKLPVAFDALTFPGATMGALYAACEFAVTTSRAEGFGMAFVEPWLAGRGIIGRDLPEITVDFLGVGLDLRHLYPRLPIPSGWFNVEQYRREREAVRREQFLAYGFDPPHEEAAAQSVDFAELSEGIQREIIERARDSSDARAELQLPEWRTPPPELIRSNARVAREQFSVTAYGERLAALYRSVVECPPQPPGTLRAAEILRAFILNGKTRTVFRS